jgi:hypothetical protein
MLLHAKHMPPAVFLNLANRGIFRNWTYYVCAIDPVKYTVAKPARPHAVHQLAVVHGIRIGHQYELALSSADARILAHIFEQTSLGAERQSGMNPRGDRNHSRLHPRTAVQRPAEHIRDARILDGWVPLDNYDLRLQTRFRAEFD